MNVRDLLSTCGHPDVCSITVINMMKHCLVLPTWSANTLLLSFRIGLIIEYNPRIALTVLEVDMSDDYTSTGIAGADKILGQKGIPRGHSILIAGGPGSGKTTFAIQFLYKGAMEYNEPGIYISLDEDPEDVKKNMSKFGWDLGKLEQEKKLAFINVSPVRVTSSEKAGLIQLGMKEFKLIKLLEAIRQGIEGVQARRVVIDPITIFTLQYPDEVERIYAMRDLIADFRKTGCTNLLISELRGTGLEREHQFEEYLAQGVILLRTVMKDDKLTRMFQVEKMRGLAVDNQPRPYDITSSGIEVYPTLTVFK
jgi:KaiC/GvpD/RAD55 family RecA-like ATPase